MATYLDIGGVVVKHSRYVLIREGARGVADQETSLACKYDKNDDDDDDDMIT